VPPTAPSLFLLMIVRARARAEPTFESYKSIIALQPVIQIRELPRNLIVAMPSRDSLAAERVDSEFAPRGILLTLYLSLLCAVRINLPD